MGAVRDTLPRYTHILLLCHHLPDNCFILIGFLAAGFAALEQAVIALGIEQPFLIKSGFLEAVIHIGGDKQGLPAGRRPLPHDKPPAWLR